MAFRVLKDDKTLSLHEDQQKEIKENLKRLEGDLSEAIRRLYRQLYLPSRDGWKELDLGIPTYGETRSIDQEIYDKLRLEGEILEKIAPLVIKERYLKERDYVLTEQLFQSGLRTPGEPRPTSSNIWELGIAEGVNHGLFGVGELEDDKPLYRYFHEEPSISFMGNEILITAEICEAQRAEKEGKVIYPPGRDKPPGGIGDGGEEPYLKPSGEGGDTPQRPHAGEMTTLQLSFDLPKGKVASLLGVLNFLQSRYNRMEMSLKVDDGSISEQEYEDKIREAFRQMGVDIE